MICLLLLQMIKDVEVIGSLLTTKLYFPPPRPSLVPRPRLVARLQAGMQGPLTLVSAPAGSGKTTVLSQWRHGPGSGAPVAWLSLDHADNDPARFLQYLSAALDTLEPGLEEEARPLLQSAEPPNGEAVLTLLINRLSGLEEDAVLALDDFHLIENPVIHTALNFLLEHLPPCLHLVILSRADPPLPLARLRARGQLVELRLADLRFSVEESAQFLNQVMGLDLTGKQVAALEKRTEGWIAGLQLAALSMHGREDVDGFVSAFTGSNHYIVDYLAEEVLTHQPEPLRQFLLKTSILDRMTGTLCDALTGEQDGEAFLKQLERTNLFVIPLDDEQRWYRYHHLFSDLLRLGLEQNHPGLLPGLHLRASRWYEAQGMLAEALDHALAAGEVERVAKIVSSNVLILTEGDGVRSILQNIDALPPGQLSAQPWLGIARAWALGAGQVQNAHRILDAVEKNLDSVPNELERKRLRGHIAAVRAFVYFHQGEMSRVIAFTRLADELLPEEEIAVRALNLVIWGGSLGYTRQDRGDKSVPMLRYNPDAVPILEKALHLALQSGKPHLIMVATVELANDHVTAGRFREAHRVCQEALAIAEEAQRRAHRSLRAAANIYIILGVVLSEWGESDDAIKAAQKALSLNEQNVQVVEEIQCLTYLGRILEVAGEWDRARQVFQRAETTSRQISPWYWQLTMHFILNSMLDVETIDSDEIVRLLRQIRESGIDIRLETQARLSIRDGHPAEALGLLDQALANLEGRASADLVRIHILRAVAFQAAGAGDQAIASLRQALELGEPENRVAAFVREGLAAESLLRSVQAKSISPEFVRRLLAAFEARRKRGSGPAPAAQALVEPLSGRELEVLKLLAQGCPDKQIAGTLVIARETVHKHLKNIYGKLGVHSRTEAIARARELGLL